MGKRAPPDLKAELTDRLEHHFLLTVSPPLHSSFSTRHFHTGIWHEHPFPSSPADAHTLFPLQLHTAAPPGRPPVMLRGGAALRERKEPRPSPPSLTAALSHSGSGARERRQGAPPPRRRSRPGRPPGTGPAATAASPRRSYLLSAPTPTAPQFKPPRHTPRMRTAYQPRPRRPMGGPAPAPGPPPPPPPPPLPPRLAHAQGGKGGASVPGGVEHARSCGGVARAQRSRRACGRREAGPGGVAQLG